MTLGHGDPFCDPDTNENPSDSLSDLGGKVPREKLRSERVDCRKIARELRGGISHF